MMLLFLLALNGECENGHKSSSESEIRPHAYATSCPSAYIPSQIDTKGFFEIGAR
jgi:hypothetical protein